MSSFKLYSSFPTTAQLRPAAQPEALSSGAPPRRPIAAQLRSSPGFPEGLAGRQDGHCRFATPTAAPSGAALRGRYSLRRLYRKYLND